MIRSILAIAFLLAALCLALPAGATPGATAAPVAPGAPTVAETETADPYAGAGVIPSPKAGIPMAIAAMVIFVIVLLLLQKTAWPKILGGLADREVKLREGIEASKRLKAEADRLREDYESKLAEARADAQTLLAETKAQQQVFAAELRQKAEQELTAMKDRARRDIEAAKRAAINEIYNETADLATMVASKILKREVSPSDQQRLVDESLAQLQARN